MPKAVACGGWQWTTDLIVRPLLHDRQVQHDLAGPLPLAAELLALHVDDAQVVGLHKALADQRRRADDLVLADAVADVAVVGRGEALLVEAVADFANFLLDLVDVQHMDCPSVAVRSILGMPADLHVALAVRASLPHPTMSSDVS